jgi:hypothetical protein
MALEIQEIAKPFLRTFGLGHNGILSDSSVYYVETKGDIIHWVWLPHQEDLQAMVYVSRCDGEGFEYGLIDLWEDFEQFMNSDYPDGHFMNSTNKMDTFEQAWILYVMLRKFNKIFNEHDWVTV